MRLTLQDDGKDGEELHGGVELDGIVFQLFPERQAGILALGQVKGASEEPVEEEKGDLSNSKLRGCLQCHR